MNRHEFWLIAVLSALLVASPASAYSPAKPHRHDVFSQNGLYVLDVDPIAEVNTVYSVADRTRPMWSFPGLSGELLSNDGMVVVFVNWRFVTEEHLATATGVEFRNRDGAFKSYLVRELVPDPPLTQDIGPGPIGDFWRTWYSEVKDDGDEFSLRTTGIYDYRFRFSNGEMISRTWHPRFHRPHVIAGAVVAGLILIALTYYILGRRRRAHKSQFHPE